MAPASPPCTASYAAPTASWPAPRWSWPATACAAERGGVHAEERPADQPGRRREIGQFGIGGRPSLQRDGHELREPGAGGRVSGQESQEAREEGVSGADGD